MSRERVEKSDVTPWRSVVGELTAERLRAGLTQVDVARAAGLSEHVIQKMESGQTAPTVARLQRYARALNGELVISLAGRTLVGDVPAGSTGDGLDDLRQRVLGTWDGRNTLLDARVLGQLAGGLGRRDSDMSVSQIPAEASVTFAFARPEPESAAAKGGVRRNGNAASAASSNPVKRPVDKVAKRTRG